MPHKMCPTLTLETRSQLRSTLALAKGRLQRWGWLSRRRPVASTESRLSFWELLKLSAPEWHIMLASILCFAAIGCAFSLHAFVYSEVLRVYGETDREELEQGIPPLSLAFVGLAISAGLIYFAAMFLSSVAGERMTKRMRQKSFVAILAQDISWFDKPENSTGILTTRLAVDASAVKGATGIRLGTIFQNTCGFLATVAIGLAASWELILLLMFNFPILGILIIAETTMTKGRAQKNKRRIEESGQTVFESVENIRTVVSFGLERAFHRKYCSQLKKPFRSNVRSVLFQAAVYATAQSLLYIMWASGYRLSASLVVDGRASYDEIYRVFGAVILTAMGIGFSTTFIPDMNKAQMSAARILALLRTEPAVNSTNKGGMQLPTTPGRISVNNVRFNYPTRPQVSVLEGVSVHARPGRTLALVGPSGSGKSTIIALLQRFYDPNYGSVTLDGMDIRDLDLRWLRSQIGIVPQEPVLFNQTIGYNIRYGANFKHVTEEDIVQAAKEANIHSFVETLPQGYRTLVGPKGVQLSGGQKQRVAIARALIRDPKILLLDEATSSLDSINESLVQEALKRACEGRTTIVIAHRLSTTQNADRIAVIQGGKVVEIGTHNELISNQRQYYHLYKCSAWK